MNHETHNQDLVQTLRERVDAEHARAIEALRTVERYLGEDCAVAESPPSQTGDVDASVLSFQVGQNGTKRDRVCAAISGRFASVPEIAALTQLNEDQVRGVLYAPDILRRIKKRIGENGLKEFNIPENEET